MKAGVQKSGVLIRAGMESSPKEKKIDEICNSLLKYFLSKDRISLLTQKNIRVTRIYCNGFSLNREVIRVTYFKIVKK
jgi:hypothetical protein